MIKTLEHYTVASSYHVQLIIIIKQVTQHVSKNKTMNRSCGLAKAVSDGKIR